MKINKLNYEIYFLDYYDGNLSAEQTAELMLFLEQHADLKLEFEAFENIVLEKPVYSFNKNNLKKTITPVGAINEDNFDDFFIEELEGGLTNSEELNTFLKKNPELEKERSLYQKTILKPDHFVYENKEELKKTLVVQYNFRKVITYAVSTAAILIFGLFLFNNETGTYVPRSINQLAAITIPEIIDNNPIIAPTIEKSSTSHLQPKTSYAIAVNNKSISTSQHVEEKLLSLNNTEEKQSESENNDLLPIKRNNTKEEGKKDIPPKQVIKPTIKPKTETTTHLTPKEFFAQNFRKRVLKRDKNELEKDRITPLEIAEAGLNTINKIFGSNFSVAPKYDEDGDMVAYAISSDRFEMQKNVKK